VQERLPSSKPAENPVDKVLAKVGDVAVLPQVVCQVLEFTGNEDAGTQQLVKVITVDPGFSAKILAQANSVFYALPRKVTSIHEALMFLGFKQIRQLAMAVGVFDLFVGKNDKESLRRRTWWKHSIDTAACCRAISMPLIDVNPDDAYTCGLLHLIGKTLLDRFDPDQYSRVQGVVDQGAPDVLAERAVFGCDHIAVGHAASVKWGFPDSLSRGLDYFTPSDQTGPDHALRACVAIGSRLVRLAHAGVAPQEVRPEMLPSWPLVVLALPGERIPMIADRGMRAILSNESFVM
jgi:HD-like signal output (HDOD) protein